MELYWSDIWVLQSLKGGAGEGDLDISSVIAFTDALNYAILTSEEFNNAIYRLEEFELIRVSGKSVLFTSLSKELFKKYEKQSIRKQTESLEKKLGAIGYNSEYNPNNLVAPKEFISKGHFNSAVENYRRQYGI